MQFSQTIHCIVSRTHSTLPPVIPHWKLFRELKVTRKGERNNPEAPFRRQLEDLIVGVWINSHPTLCL